MTKEQFSELVLDSTDSLYRVAKAILPQDADCEDAISEAITIGFSKIHTLKKDEYARTWLTRILINECRKLLKSRQIHLVPLDEVSIADREQKDYSDLYAAIQTLKEKHRIVIVLHYLEGYSVPEIARITNSAEGTVKSRLSRARETLKNLLKEDYAHGFI